MQTSRRNFLRGFLAAGVAAEVLPQIPKIFATPPYLSDLNKITFCSAKWGN